MKLTPRNIWLFISALVVFAGLAYNIDGYPLLDPDEGRNAEVAREMASTNDYVLPRLNGLPYPDKPVLYFAAVSISMEILGPTVLAARLPSLAFTLATLVLVWFAGRRWFGPKGGWTAAIAAGSSPLTLGFARTTIFDSALTFFVVLSVFAFYEAVEQLEAANRGEPKNYAEWWSTLAWGAAGLGVLTKGPVALVLPLMVATPYIAWRGAWRAIATPISVLLFVAILLPWIVAVSRQVPDFLHYALVTETIRRVSTAELHRTGPVWYFLPILPAAALPWSLVAVAGWKRSTLRTENGELDRRIVLLLIWIFVPLLFFTLAQSKRPQYILPLIAPIALLVGALWSREGARLSGARAATVFLATIGLTMVVLGGQVASLLDVTSEIAARIPATAVALGGVAIAAAVGGWLGAKRWEAALLAFALPVASIPFVSGGLMREIGRDRSTAEVAAALDRVLTPETQVVGVRTYPLSLPFYIRRPIILSTDTATELTSNYLSRYHRTWRNTPDSPLRPGDWWRDALLECNRPRIFLVRTGDREARDLLNSHLKLLIETRKIAAYGPCGEPTLALTRGTPSDQVASPFPRIPLGTN